MTLVENALLSASARLALAKYGLINWSKTRNFAGEIIAQFDVRTPSTEVVARALSGGNLQKFVVGREIMQKPKLLIINQPTWGVDAAAASAIRQALLDLAAQGAAVVVISQDLDELIEISDQFAALYEGGLSEPCPIEDLSFEEIGLLMGGVQSRENTHATA
ncbi:MAG: ABC transporter ATP-binding protein, partial [Paracoccaceae bacterium]|nr:ABC transporter ATP-binding protein [Paracoccaceae bacterium]